MKWGILEHCGRSSSPTTEKHTILTNPAKKQDFGIQHFLKNNNRRTLLTFVERKQQLSHTDGDFQRKSITETAEGQFYKTLKTRRLTFDK